jgi:hypothetical protein
MRADEDQRDAQGGREPGRSLAIVTESGGAPAARTPPAFLAQLIASDRRLPDQRRARREAPEAATSAYRYPQAPAPHGLDLTV